MNSLAKITKKYVIHTKMETLAPIRIASGMDDGITDIIILKNKQGKAFIPGTSLAGVLRSAMKNIYGEEVVAHIFGHIKNNGGEQSMLNISDIILDGSELIYRDGVAIDTYRGVGKKGAKYDFEALDKGAFGELCIEMTVRNKQKPFDITYLHNDFAVSGDFYSEVIATIVDLLTGGISVGSLTTKGFGLIGSKKPTELYCFDFTDGAADKWLAYITESKLPKAFYIGSADKVAAGNMNVFTIEADFAVSSSLIIRDYDEAQEINDANGKKDLKLAAVQMKSGADLIIPGSSIKGALRSRAQKIIMSLSGGAVKEAQDFVATLMGFADDSKACKSRLCVRESYISSKTLVSHRHSRNRIDRFTCSTIDGALFTEEPVWQRDKSLSPLKLSLSVNQCSDVEAGLMLLLLKDLWLGMLPLGGGKGIGRGTLIGRQCKIYYKREAFVIKEGESFEINGDSAKLEQYVQAFVKCAKEMAVKR